MRILEVCDNALFEVGYLAASPERRMVSATLAVQRVLVDRLPGGLQAVFVTSDLQGRTHAADGSARLLGHALAEDLATFCAAMEVDAEATAVLLGGDLFALTDLTRRGGLGDVRDVWRGFSEHFGFVAGVAGNHDDFGGSTSSLEAFCAEPRIHFLDGGMVELGVAGAGPGLRVAGVSGVIGNPHKPWRRAEEDYLAAVAGALALAPDILVLHQNPALPDTRRRDAQRLAELLAKDATCLVAFGHSACTRAVVDWGRAQLLATDHRAFWLEKV